MPKQMVKVTRASGAGRDLALDIVSYGRRGPVGTLQLGQDRIEQVQRTVGRTPEVMIKVSGGGRDSGTVRAHLKYVGRHGKLSIETDDGLEMQGREAADALIDDWALDQCRSAHRPKPAEGEKDTRSKLVHNIVLSMPAGTPPDKVLAAAKVFARENFALQYRYAMVLHTDQAHPHVHLVVKCEHEYEPRKRLYIRKDILRRWREQFAELMREQGVAANATPRQVRGQTRRPLRDPIHHRLRAMRAFNGLDAQERQDRHPPSPSRFMRAKVLDALTRMRGGGQPLDAGRSDLQTTRDAVTSDWQSTAHALRQQGRLDLASRVERFVDQMRPVRTDAEHLAERWGRERTQEPPAHPRPPNPRSR
ncbi:relaxase [Xenophilus aerolatus]|nr:relaxase [Xenophilus aerolatus]